MKINKAFEKICRMTQQQVATYNVKALSKAGYKEIVKEDGFVFAKGELPILLVAHMDTVHKETPILIDYKEDGNIISSPQGIGGDDRCGIHMIHEIIKTHKCSILFTEDEEIGGVGADKFIKSPYLQQLIDLNINYMIELDRKGNNDAVFYECANEDFTDFIIDNSSLKEEWGSFTDICILMPEIGVAGVNISCGYYNAHTKDEYVDLSEMEIQIQRVKDIINQPCEEPFEFIEDIYGGLSDDWYYDYDTLGYKPNLYDSTEKVFYIEYNERNAKSKLKKDKTSIVEVLARSQAEAVGTLLMNNPELTYGHIEEIYEE